MIMGQRPPLSNGTRRNRARPSHNQKTEPRITRSTRISPCPNCIYPCCRCNPWLKSSLRGMLRMFDLASVQSALRQLGFDGWLLYDFRGLNVLARRVVGLSSEAMLSRRWFYYVPAQGEPRKLVHRIEPHALDHLPGPQQVYLRWQELEAGVASLVKGAHKVAMEYA